MFFRKQMLLCFFAAFSVYFRCIGESYDFVNQEISEILFSISNYRGFPITADDSVSGKADFRFAGGNFDEAFESFLRSSRLYVEKNEKEWVVSRMRFLRNASGEFAVDACDVSPSLLLEKAGINLGIFIAHDGLPEIKISVHTGFCLSHEIIERIISLCPGFEIENVSDNKMKIVRSEKRNINSQNEIYFEKCDFTKCENGKWSCDIQNAVLMRAVEKLCTLTGNQFVFISGGEGKISRSKVFEKDINELISLICLQSGCEVVESDGIFYIAPMKDSRNRLSSAARKWNEKKLKFSKPEIIVSALEKRFPAMETFSAGNANLILFRCDENELNAAGDFIDALDTAENVHIVNLKFLKTKDFLEHLPPFIERSWITDLGNGNSFYFTGSEENFLRLESALPEIDRPVSTITYDLLIMQYQQSDGSDWTPSFKADRIHLGDRTALNASIGSVLDLSLDVVGAFGMTFAANLQTAITEARAKVFADTTLHGVSGSTINFQNVNTYRYRDNNLDPKTGKPIYSGVTKEISSGLKLEVTGFVSGDGMITSKITASVSRQGEDTSSITGNPPPTSEKIVTTEVRCRSGEPVVLSGLSQEEESFTGSRTPLISKIPLLGWFFKSRTKVKEKTELVIYLVPKAEIWGEKSGNEVFVENLNIKNEKQRLYEKYVKQEA